MKILIMYSTHSPNQSHFDSILRIVPDATVVNAENESHAVREAKDAEIIFGHRYLRQVLPGAAQLKWVQTTAGGVDRLPLKELQGRDILLTRMTIASPVIARHAVSMAWALNRRLHETVINQTHHQMNRDIDLLPLPENAMVFGTGSIGRQIAKILAAQGMTVYGVKRSKPDQQDPDFDQLFDHTSFYSRLPSTDWVFNALPYTAETEHFFNKSLMEKLPSHAIFINVGRGETVVTSHLCELLREQRLGGAGLDVIYPKPQHDEDQVWTTPNLMLTPHVAAHYPARAADMDQFCEEQLRRYMQGDTLENVVDLAKTIQRIL